MYDENDYDRMHNVWGVNSIWTLRNIVTCYLLGKCSSGRAFNRSGIEPASVEKNEIISWINLQLLKRHFGNELIDIPNPCLAAD